MTGEARRYLAITRGLMDAEDDVAGCMHEMSLVAELLGQTGCEEISLTAEAADGLDTLLTRAADATRGLLDMLSDRDNWVTSSSAPLDMGETPLVLDMGKTPHA